MAGVGTARTFAKLPQPFVTVLVPVRNEEAHLGQCLSSITECNYPQDRLEVLVIDGRSTDRTRVIVENFTARFKFMQLIDNPSGIVPKALNIGIKTAKGDIIIRMDAHAEYPSDYISKCVKWLLSSGADNVGGQLVVRPGADDLASKAIALVLSHPFGVGDALYRIGTSRPRWVDTVPFGTYHRELFEQVGTFDEDLVRNQDDEFNHRVTRHGGRILLIPDIVSYYYARESLSKLYRQFFQYGYWKVRVLQKHRMPSTWRQLIPAMLILALVGSALLAIGGLFGRVILIAILGIYLACVLVFSIQLSTQHGLRYLRVLPAAFVVLHFGYGFGFLKGIWDFVVW